MAKPIAALIYAVAVFTAVPAVAQGPTWVERSNGFTQQVIAVQA